MPHTSGGGISGLKNQRPESGQARDPEGLHLAESLGETPQRASEPATRMRPEAGRPFEGSAVIAVMGSDCHGLGGGHTVAP
jgi:hypothetical protein